MTVERRTSFGDLIDALRTDGTGNYRKVDHWIRGRLITLSCGSTGSGRARTVTDAEARALRRWAAEWTALDDARYAMQSGRRWSEILGEEHATGGGA